MRASSTAVLFGFWLVAAPAALAAGMVTAFESGGLPGVALPDVKVKAIVAEFLDPDKSEAGKEIGHLIWREILTAISDQKGSGVIIARPSGKVRLVDMIQQNYHRAALEIAESQKARMAVWGSVSESDGRLAIDSYLSLVGDAVREELALRLKASQSFGEKRYDTGLSARIARTRFNFPRVWLTRDQLFLRPLLLQVNAVVRDQPSKEAGKAIVSLRANELLQSEGMQGEWFQVRTRGGRVGYVDSKDVYVPPQQVLARGQESVRSRPAIGAPAIGTTTPAERYQVKASKYVDRGGLWYQIETPAGSGWVRALHLQSQFSLPIVHFVAGLYRYQLGRYEDAAREFEHYTRMDGVKADPASLSTAYQLLGASQVMNVSKSSNAVVTGDRRLIFPLSEAVLITPFDPSAYALLVLVRLAVDRSIPYALPDLRKALEYDPGHRDARITLNRLKTLSANGGPVEGQSSRIVSEIFRGESSVFKEVEALSVLYSNVPIRGLAVGGTR